MTAAPCAAIAELATTLASASGFSIPVGYGGQCLDLCCPVPGRIRVSSYEDDPM